MPRVRRQSNRTIIKNLRRRRARENDEDYAKNLGLEFNEEIIR